MDAGLLKPDAVKSGASGTKPELTAKQEKALEKKEKVKLMLLYLVVRQGRFTLHCLSFYFRLD